MVYDIFIILIPLILCAGLLLYYHGLPNLWSVTWRALLVAPLCFFLITELPIMNMRVDYVPTNDLAQILKKAFLGASIPEEISKLATLYYIVWRVFKCKLNKFSDAFLCSVIIGTLFSVSENLAYANMGLGRVFAFAGHLSYAVIMGYCFSLLYSANIKKHRCFVATCMILIPITCHGIWDAAGLGLMSLYTGWRSYVIYMICLSLPIVLCVSVYKLCRKTKHFNLSMETE